MKFFMVILISIAVFKLVPVTIEYRDRIIIDTVYVTEGVRKPEIVYKPILPGNRVLHTLPDQGHL